VFVEIMEFLGVSHHVVKVCSSASKNCIMFISRVTEFGSASAYAEDSSSMFLCNVGMKGYYTV
jgi:hypothetical protein